MATSSQADVLDIAHGFNGPSTFVQSSVLQSPVALDADGQIVPQLAKAWTQPTPDTYVFELRDDVVFSDGTPMTAEDVAFSLERHLDPAVASQAAGLLTAVESVRASGKHEVTVDLKFPTQAFLASAPMVWQVVPKSLAEAHPQDLGTPEVGVIGTGPYKVTKFSLTDGIVLEANSEYWGPKPAIERVKVVAITDPEAMRLAISSGSVDGTSFIPPEDARKWTDMKGVDTRFFAGNSIASIYLNVQDPHLSDVHVRRAIAHAVNTEAVQRLVVGDQAQPAQTIVTVPQLKALYGDDFEEVTSDLPSYPYDLDAAKSELAKSEFPDGFEMTVNYSSGSESADALQAIAADLSTIGIEVVLNPVPDDAYWSTLMRHEDLTIGITDLGYGSADVGELLPDFLTSTGAKAEGFNFSQYSTPEMDAKVTEALSLTGDARKLVVTDILTEVADQALYVPLYSTNAGIALNERYAGDIGVWTRDYFSAIRPVDQ